MVVGSSAARAPIAEKFTRATAAIAVQRGRIQRDMRALLLT
jgi:hypothetical protein